jgi:hypothetical protein
MFKDKLKEYVETSNLVNMKEAGNGIYVLKYKKKVFYDNLWNEYIAECRGSIVDADFNLVAYPFTKIYNYGIEKEAPVLADDVEVLAYRKVNGFMVACTLHNGSLLVSTTGSTDSDYVNMARELIDEAKYLDLCSRWEGYTFMFECVHKNDPHIVPEKEGMYILGYRENKWHTPVEHDPFMLMEMGRALGCFVPESVTTSMAALKNLAKECKHEGYVAYTEDGISFKIKSPYYLTSKWVARNPRTDKLVDLKKDIKHNIDEEYYGLIDAIRLNIEAYTAMNEQARLSWVRDYMETV